jgi:hypothetical protein
MCLLSKRQQEAVTNQKGNVDLRREKIAGHHICSLQGGRRTTHCRF